MRIALHTLGKIHGYRSTLLLDVSIAIDDCLRLDMMFHILVIHQVYSVISKTKGFGP